MLIHMEKSEHVVFGSILSTKYLFANCQAFIEWT